MANHIKDNRNSKEIFNAGASSVLDDAPKNEDEKRKVNIVAQIQIPKNIGEPSNNDPESNDSSDSSSQLENRIGESEEAGWLGPAQTEFESTSRPVKELDDDSSLNLPQTHLRHVDEENGLASNASSNNAEEGVKEEFSSMSKKFEVGNLNSNEPMLDNSFVSKVRSSLPDEVRYEAGDSDKTKSLSAVQHESSCEKTKGLDLLDHAGLPHSKTSIVLNAASQASADLHTENGLFETSISSISGKDVAAEPFRSNPSLDPKSLPSNSTLNPTTIGITRRDSACESPEPESTDTSSNLTNDSTAINSLDQQNLSTVLQSSTFSQESLSNQTEDEIHLWLCGCFLQVSIRRNVDGRSLTEPRREAFSGYMARMLIQAGLLDLCATCNDESFCLNLSNITGQGHTLHTPSGMRLASSLHVRANTPSTGNCDITYAVSTYSNDITRVAPTSPCARVRAASVDSSDMARTSSINPCSRARQTARNDSLTPYPITFPPSFSTAAATSVSTITITAATTSTTTAATWTLTTAVAGSTTTTTAASSCTPRQGWLLDSQMRFLVSPRVLVQDFAVAAGTALDGSGFGASVVNLQTGAVMEDQSDLDIVDDEEDELVGNPEEFNAVDDIHILDDDGEDIDTNDQADGRSDRQAIAELMQLPASGHRRLAYLHRRFRWGDNGDSPQLCVLCSGRPPSVVVFNCQHRVLCHFCVETESGRVCPLCHWHIRFYYRFDRFT